MITDKVLEKCPGGINIKNIEKCFTKHRIFFSTIQFYYLKVSCQALKCRHIEENPLLELSGIAKILEYFKMLYPLKKKIK